MSASIAASVIYTTHRILRRSAIDRNLAAGSPDSEYSVSMCGSVNFAGTRRSVMCLPEEPGRRVRAMAIGIVPLSVMV